MKKIYNILIALVALLAFAPFMSAQDVPFPADNNIIFSQTEWSKQYDINEESGVAYRKIISKPNTQGIYHILLDAFVTGREIKTQKSLPADIVLVLDVSNSMRYNMGSNTGNNEERLNALKTAVKGFIDLINTNDLEKAPSGKTRLGNRIAIVPFASGIETSGNDQVRNFRTMDQAQAMKTNIDNLYRNGGTSAHLGMQRALQLLQNSTSHLKTVVFFTDGDPGFHGDWTSRTRIESQYQYDNETYYYQNTWYSANHTIDYANQIKNLAVESDNPEEKVISNVFTVSIINNPSDYTKVYLAKTSSNYLGATNMGSITVNSNNQVSGWTTTPDIYANGNGTRNTSETNFALSASTTQELINAFATIAEASGGSSDALGESSVSTVDVVSASFMLPPGADKNSIRVYTAPCESVPASGQPSFGTMIQADGRTDMYQPKKKVNGVLVDDGPEKDVDNAIKTGLEGNKITVEGFDFSNLWCGEIVENGTHVGWNGYKVTILIPIKMNPDALGGVGVDTNGEGSGIFINGENEFPFESPQVNLPVNIIINKQGLKEGESSKFTILRSTDKSSWEEVTSVFVTRHKNQGINEPRTRIEGLPATNASGVEYIYKIREDDWSWSYTLTTGRELTTEDNDNPFTFKNTPKANIDTKIRHAESKATNTFTTGAGDKYDDSKTNNDASRTIIQVSSSSGSGSGTGTGTGSN